MAYINDVIKPLSVLSVYDSYYLCYMLEEVSQSIVRIDRIIQHIMECKTKKIGTVSETQVVCHLQNYYKDASVSTPLLSYGLIILYRL